MRIKNLLVENFQGIKKFEVAPDGKDVTISGRNASGKSTMLNAACWLLFDKGGNFKQLQPKPIDPDGNDIHGMDSSVEAVFSMGGKNDVALKKVSSEKWTKKRGKAEKVFSGHEIKYFINDVPQKMGEFKETVSEISGGEDMFKLLSSPFYFSQVLSWRDRRAMVMNVCGDVDLFSQVIASNEKLASLPEMLGEHTVDDYRKIIVARRKKTNDELSKIPVRIDEIQRGLPEPPVESEKGLKKLKDELTDNLKKSSAVLDNVGTISEKILQLSTENERLYTKHFRTCTEQVNDLKRRAFAFRNDLDVIERSIEKADKIDALIKEKNALLKKMREDFKAERDIVFTPATGDEAPTCHACGQAIPEDMQKDTFGKARDRRLSEINTEGKKIAAELKDLKEEGDTLMAIKGDIPSTLEEIASIDKQIHDLEAKRKDPPSEATQNSEEIKRLRGLATPVEQPAVSQEEKDMLDNVSRKISAYERLKEAGQRLEQLKKEEQSLGRTYETCEHTIWMLDEYTRSLVSYLEQRVQEFFGGVRFKMFEEQINGGISECCEVLCDGIPFNGGLNHSAQINTGIKIINSFSKYYGVEVPIWVDNAEAVNKLEGTPNQLIQLVVSNDKKLTIKEV